MPLVNIYSSQNPPKELEGVVTQLKEYLARRLTCSGIQLSPSEISVRFIQVAGGEMIGEIEVEITAHAFPERVKEQDEICRDVVAYIKETTRLETKVWLKLPELGHSW